ncbi:MAG: hypothetical protein ACE5R6_05995 [Candidatus Heimdallarchaeota archaeon]
MKISFSKIFINPDVKINVVGGNWKIFSTMTGKIVIGGTLVLREEEASSELEGFNERPTQSHEVGDRFGK